MWPKLRLFFVTAGWTQSDTPDGMFSKSISQVHLTKGPWKTFGKGWSLKKKEDDWTEPLFVMLQVDQSRFLHYQWSQ